MVLQVYTMHPGECTGSRRVVQVVIRESTSWQQCAKVVEKRRVEAESGLGVGDRAKHRFGCRHPDVEIEGPSYCKIRPRNFIKRASWIFR